jgi:putative glycosyltransferase
MDLSIVTTLYNSENYLEAVYVRATAAAKKLTKDYEVIFVNDGSPDNSLEAAISLFEKDENVRVIDLSRNFGHHKAMMTGLAHARGGLVFLLDCDLEEDPELLSQFYDEMKRSHADVVYGVQEKRKGGIFERFTAAIAYSIFNFWSSHPIPRNVTTARLMTRRYVNALLQHKEREVAIAGLWVITGFKQVSVPIVKRTSRNKGYTLGKRIAVFVDLFTSFSNKPLVFIFYLGCLISLLSAAAAAYLVIRVVFFGAMLAGWPSLIVSVWLLGGMAIFCIGVVGIYVSKIFSETKQRPYTLIRDIYDHRSIVE